MGCFIHIVAGAGGAEAADCANILFRMYKNWCDLRAYSLAVVNAVPGEIAGIKSAVMEIQTLEAYPLVRGEQGVHRFVRISPFDAQARRHTSFINVRVSDNVQLPASELENLRWFGFIRCYVFHPYQMVKDFRTLYQVNGQPALENVLNGNLDPFVNAWVFAGSPAEPPTPEEG